MRIGVAKEWIVTAEESSETMEERLKTS